MSRPADITGKRFGKLIAVERISERHRNKIMWRCRCDCGGETTAHVNALMSGEKRTCGCGFREDISGNRFGRLTAIRFTGKSSRYGCRLWECRCDCGKTVIATLSLLKSGDKQSCGCLKSEKASITALSGIHDGIVKDGTNISLIKSSEPYSTNRCGIRGISLVRDKWHARITFKKQTIHLGYFEKIEDAVAARKAAEGKYFRPFLDGLNDPDKN